jgi:hypothetical protein
VNFSRAKQARNARSTALANVVGGRVQGFASLNSSCSCSSTVRVGQWARSMCHTACPAGVPGACRGCPGLCSWSICISYQNATQSIPKHIPDHCISGISRRYGASSFETNEPHHCLVTSVILRAQKSGRCHERCHCLAISFQKRVISSSIEPILVLLEPSKEGKMHLSRWLLISEPHWCTLFPHWGTSRCSPSRDT